MGNVSRTEGEKMEIGQYAEDHTINATKERFGCHPDTARKYHKKYGGKKVDEAIHRPTELSEQLENELHRSRQENEKLKNIIINKMLED